MMKLLVPLLTAASANGLVQQRQLGPADCITRVYHRTDESPIERNDQTCDRNSGIGIRSFLADEKSGGSDSKLSEVKPLSSNAVYHCRADRDCSFAIEGHGLNKGDKFAVLSGQDDCGTDKKPLMEGDVKFLVHRPKTTGSDIEGKALIAPSNSPLLEFKEGTFNDKEASYNICYLPALSIPRDAEAEKDTVYPYKAGKITVGDSIFACDFESDRLEECGFSSTPANFDVDFTWKVSKGASTTSGSGPEGDHTNEDGKGGYATVKSRSHLADGTTAVLQGPPVVLPPGDNCIAFAYNAHGDDVDSLRVYLSPLDDSRMLQIDAMESVQERGRFWGDPQWVIVGNKGPKWHLGGFDAKITDDKPRQLIFEGVNGRSEKGDIAIDDISIKPGRCPAQIRTMPKSRVGTKEMICGQVRMTTGSHPEDKAWSLENAISCAGRGYSLAQLQHAWVPCCVPQFGTYNLKLHDRMNDGWEKSKLELRFFDRMMTYGEDLDKRSGDVTIPITIGQLEIRNTSYAQRRIAIDVGVVHANSNVYCGVAEAGPDGQVRNPIPHKKLMKEFGVKAPDATMHDNEVVKITIEGDFIEDRKLYDIYCYAERAARELLTDAAAEDDMDDAQLAATRVRIMADNEPPVLKQKEVEIQSTHVIVHLVANEPSEAFCAAVLAEVAGKNPVTAAYLQQAGTKVTFDAQKAFEASVEFPNLASNSEYELHCLASDFSEPRPNTTPDEALKKGGVDGGPVKFKTVKRAPNATIEKVAAINNGFDVFVTLDSPGKVHCAAATENVAFPSVTEVIGAGASAEMDRATYAEDPFSRLRIAIRGVKPQSPYTVYCAASTSDGSLKTYDKDMWRRAHAVTSFGRFCEISALPSITDRDENASPFDPITGDEEMAIRRFVLQNNDLKIESVYRVNLLPNKTEIYDHYRTNAPLPKRYARVRAGRCLDSDRGFYEQLKIGPLDEKVENFTWERLAKPVETSCGGYTIEGIFGRRRLSISDDETFESLQRIFRDSFGHEFASARCATGGSQCLRIGGMALQLDENAEDSEGSRRKRKLSEAEQPGIWIGLRQPSGTPVPFYYKVELSELGADDAGDFFAEGAGSGDGKKLSPSAVRHKLDQIDWLHHPRSVWYNGFYFKNADELVRSYMAGHIERVTPSLMEKKLEDFRARRRRLSSADDGLQRTTVSKGSVNKRRLAPMPFPGAAGTAGQDLDRTRRRAGLEYRAPPEHVEPEGKRFQVRSHPGGASFSIDYAGWNFTITNDRDKSMQFWNLRFQDEQLAFQLGLQEALAHYTVSERTFFFLDSWYGGLGGAARPILRGYECPKHAVMLFWDQSVCVWEQDMARPIRSHYRAGEIRDAAPHLALHVRQMLTVSNYDYVTTYVFHPSGHVEMKVEFTGELYAGVEVPWWSTRQVHYGTQVTGASRFAALHAHLVVWKVDFDLGEDWNDNSVYFEEVVPDPSRLGANYINRFFAETEKQALFHLNETRSLAYEIVDEKRDTYGNFGGWRIFPGHSWGPNQPHFDLYSGPAAWAKYRAFSTVYKYDELDATLPRDNKFAGDPAVSVERYFADDEPLRHRDVVTWMSMGFMHIPCSEDYPLTIPIGNTLR